MGSLLAALISYLDARKNLGQWLVRIEDIDPPREQAGAAGSILQTLMSHGLQSDQKVRYQSSCSDLYEKRLNTLLKKGLCYYCPCSRKQLAERGGKHLPSCGKYNGEKLQNSALRFRCADKIQKWNDVILGPQKETLESDFILKRRDGFYSYQLAVVSDDIDQNISHVIRGVDLINSTPMQLALYEAFACPPPTFGHFPLVVNTQGQKLSKQNFAPAVNDERPIENLALLGKWLGLNSPTNTDRPEDYLACYVQQWDCSTFQSKQDYVL